MKKTSHSVYDLSYHIVFVTKCRRAILIDEIEEYAKRLFYNIAEHYDYEICALEVMPDHVHMLVSAKPAVAPLEMVSNFKGISARYILKKFPEVRDFLKKDSAFWSKSFYVGATGSAPEESVKHYIANQKATAQKKSALC